MQTSPWHSVKPNAPRVYHDNTECNTGNNIERENRRSGTDGRPKCQECDRLDRAGR
jgi:transposase-like protein